MKEDFVDIADVDSIKRALENAEIEYEEFFHGDNSSHIETESGITFYFNDSGMMTGME